MDDNVKRYADTLYEQSLHESARTLTDERVKSQQEMAARKSATALPLSGPEIQAILKLFVQHVERCMEARLESYRQAYGEAKRYPTDENFNEILASVKGAQELQVKHSAQALSEFRKSRGAPGADVDVTLHVTAGSAQGHDRVLAKWKVWREQIRLRKAALMGKTFEDPYPTTLNDVQAEIDHWASRQHEGQPGSDFDQNIRNRLKHLRHLHERYLRQSDVSLEAGDAGDRRFARVALEEAKRSVSEDDRVHPSVGVVIVKDGEILSRAHRGESPEGHAEYIALEKKLADTPVAGATVYTTLEPCTTRNHPKIPCVERLIERKVARVVIGMLDPNPMITGRGQLRLREANIDTVLFHPDLMREVEELNHKFTRQFRSSGVAESPSRTMEPAAAGTPQTATDVVDKWVSHGYEHKSGAAKTLEEQGFDLGWVSADREAEKVEFGDWDYVLVDQPDGKKARLRIHDHSAVGGSLVLLKRRRYKRRSNTRPHYAAEAA